MIPLKPSGTIVSRRRFLTIVGAAAGAATLPKITNAGSVRSVSWRGVALGAEASLTLQHHDETVARLAIESCLAEVARLEDVFSLHKPESALVRLNSTGYLDEAPGDLRVLVSEALRIARLTNGAFDPTVQPVWELYARQMSGHESTDQVLPQADLDAARALIGWQKVKMEGARIAFEEKGMALTLNGIAQGYITDKIGVLLRSRGFEHVLVNMGEQLALGPRHDGRAWIAGIADPLQPQRWIETVELSGGAMATSGVAHGRFNSDSRFAHILDPRTGNTAKAVECVTVLADRAVLADALSTAFAVSASDTLPVLRSSKARAYAVAAGSPKGEWL